MVSNSPQLLLAVIYVSYNLLLTSMMMTAEYNDSAVQRKALRVSKPKGQQRSTYYLQLPYRYAVPLTTCLGVLRWLVSQGLFQVKIIFYDDADEPQPAKNVLACGWSPSPSASRLALAGSWSSYSARLDVENCTKECLSCAVTVWIPVRRAIQRFPTRRWLWNLCPMAPLMWKAFAAGMLALRTSQWCR